MTSVKGKGRLKIVKDKGPGFDFIILHVIYGGESMDVTIDFPDGKKQVYLWIDELNTKHFNKTQKFEFIGHISASEKVRGYYNTRKREGWIEYYNEEAEKQVAEENLKKALVLGSAIGNLYSYLSFNVKNFDEQIVISTQMCHGEDGENEALELIKRVSSRLDQLGIKHKQGVDIIRIPISEKIDFSI